MLLEEIEKLASKGSEMPSGLSHAETAFFQEMRALYFIYKNKGITQAEAKKEKMAILKRYKELSMWEALFKNEIKIHNEIAKLIAPSAKLSTLSGDEAKALLLKIVSTIEGFE